jgi:iron complex outermembrane receptor protein
LKNVGKIFANNSNSVLIDNFNLLNLKISKDINYKKIILSPFLIVNNILGSHYYDNIRINAFGGRFYEPGPKSTIFGGVKINL